MAATQLRKSVTDIGNNVYQIDFSTLDVHLLTGKIIVKNLRLQPQDAVFTRPKLRNVAGTKYHFVASEIEIRHFHPFKFYFGNRLQIDRINIVSPRLSIDNQADSGLIKNPSTPIKLLEAKLSGKLISVNIAQILLSDLHVRFHEVLPDREIIRHFNHLQIRAADFLVDKNSIPDASRFYFCKDITAIARDFAGFSTNKRYQYQAKSVIFSSSRSEIRIKNLILEPVTSTQKNKNAAVTKPELSFDADSVNVFRFDYRRFLADKNFVAAQIGIYTGHANVFFDHRQAQRQKNIRRPGIYALLRNISQDIAIKQLFIDRVDVAYAEISPKTNLFGTITFEQLNGTLSNLNFGSDTASKPRNVVAIFNANLMGYGKLNVYAHFDAANPNALLYYRGNLGSMNLANLNPATKPLALMQFTSGFVNGLHFDMQANADTATGKVLFLYHDLNVSLLRQDEKNQLKRMGFVSILANAMLIVRDNPVYGRRPRLADVVYLRPDSASFTGMIWRSIYAGIKQSIGFSAEVEQQIRLKITNQKQNKELRQQKKAARKARRATRRLNKKSTARQF